MYFNLNRLDFVAGQWHKAKCFKTGSSRLVGWRPSFPFEVVPFNEETGQAMLCVRPRTHGRRELKCILNFENRL